jgi:hypothetical protein
VSGLRAYLAVVGAALLVQGSLSLVLHQALAVDLSPLHGFLTTDDRHAALHVAWGLVLVAVAAGAAHERTVIVAGVVFGSFYTALGVLGLLVHDPLGLHLGWGENVFHLLVGPAALILALRPAATAAT